MREYGLDDRPAGCGGQRLRAGGAVGRSKLEGEQDTDPSRTRSPSASRTRLCHAQVADERAVLAAKILEPGVGVEADRGMTARNGGRRHVDDIVDDRGRADSRRRTDSTRPVCARPASREPRRPQRAASGDSHRPMNAYPKPCTVRMKSGRSASSPSARRSSDTRLCNVTSATKVSGHNRAWMSSFETASGRRSTRSVSRSNALRVR